MLVPFLELLFDKTELITEKPNFEWNQKSVINTFYYFISVQIIENGKTAALGFFCFLVVIIFFLKNIFRYLALFILAPLRNRLILDLRDLLYRKMLKLEISFFQKNQKGDLITKFTTDLTEIEYSIMNTLETSIQSPLNIILFLGAMMTISYQLTFFVFGMILVMALFIGKIGKSLKKESKNAKDVLGKLTSIIDETIHGIKIIQAYFVQNWIYEKFKNENTRIYNVYNKMYRKRDLSSPLTEFLAIVVICIVLWFGGNMVLGGTGLSPSKFIGFMVIFSQLIPPAKSFSSAIYEIKKGMASYERIQSILNESSFYENEAHSKKMDFFNHSLDFKNVSYSYPNGPIAIQDFNFSFEKGKKYALVGASGAGKSTIFDLILRFINPTNGQILIDSAPIDTIDLRSYRYLYGIVTQEAILFNYSVAENVTFQSEENEDLNKALQISNAIDFVEKMNKETKEAIGERGSKLSGGEKQRLNIARIAYLNPEIILLDEATSALDSKNEKEVHIALEKLMEHKTSIIIAHRLSTIQNVDAILVLENGQLKEFGNHQDLIAKNGIYSEMVRLQKL
jgi:subfamily B ATP-binding cassette protein MsbA